MTVTPSRFSSSTRSSSTGANNAASRSCRIMVIAMTGLPRMRPHMRTSFHHQPEAQHPIFQLSTSWQADYPIFRHKPDIRNGAMRFAYCALGGPVSRLSRRLDAERLGDGGDLGALTLDRGDELLCSAARWRLRGRIELVVDRLVVGHRDDVGTDAFTQVRGQRLASEQTDVAIHFQLGETRFD